MRIPDTSLSAMLSEMQTWCTISPEDIQKAKDSGIRSNNNSALKALVKAWLQGVYDEDPEYLKNELLKLIPKS